MKYLILGAGPAGLAFANILKQKGETDFLILEKELKAGGLCRSEDIDGAPFDIGGGHFLDVRRPWVNDFLFQFMPEEEWKLYNRDSRIVLDGYDINYPIEANIWQMNTEDQISYLKSIAVAGCNLGDEMPEKFIDWIYWKLGYKIAEDYMIPYNQKMFGEELNQLGTYWLEKLPNVSFEEILMSCLEKKAYGKQPAHTKFYYPKKYGYGEVWLRMADNIKNNIEYGRTVQGIDFTTREVTVSDGERYRADIIITTIPWLEFNEIIGMPDEIQRTIKELKFSSIQTEYFHQNLETEAQWLYYPSMKLPYHRILVRHNFCPGSRGYWTETNSKRIETVLYNENFRYLNKYAYPFEYNKETSNNEKIIGMEQGKGVHGLGRWGEHQHYNSDVTVDQAIKLAEKIQYEKV